MVGMPDDRGMVASERPGASQSYGGEAKAPVLTSTNTVERATYSNLAPKRTGQPILSVKFNVAYDSYPPGLQMRVVQALPSGDASTGWVDNVGDTVVTDLFNGNEASHGFYLQSRIVRDPPGRREVCRPVLSPGYHYSSVSVTYALPPEPLSESAGG